MGALKWLLVFHVNAIQIILDTIFCALTAVLLIPSFCYTKQILFHLYHNSSCSGSCGYASRFEELAAQIRSSVPTADVLGKEGRRGKVEYFRKL